MEYTTGFLFGVLASLVAGLAGWVVRDRLIVPHIDFADHVEKYPIKARPTNKSGFRYRFALQNVGRRRVIDISIRATVRLPGLSDYVQLVRMPLFRPPAGPTVSVASLAGSRRGQKSKCRYYGLQVNDLGERFLTSPIYEPFHDALKRKTLTLDELLSHPEAEVTIAVFGFDGVSGTRKLFEHRYSKESIRLGRYSGLDVVAPSQVNADEEHPHETMPAPIGDDIRRSEPGDRRTTEDDQEHPDGGALQVDR